MYQIIIVTVIDFFSELSKMIEKIEQDKNSFKEQYSELYYKYDYLPKNINKY